jgi:5-methylcytosine-specific restriction endonuclease McrA
MNYGIKNESQILLDDAISCVKIFLSAEGNLIAALSKLDQENVHLELDLRSLRALAMSALGLSEDHAGNFVAIAKKSAEVPTLLTEIQSGRVSVSNARTLLPILSPENQQKWLSSACVLSKKQLQKEIAGEYPRQAPVEESMRYVSAERLQLKCGVSEELSEQIRRVQYLESSKQGKAVNIEGAIEAAVDSYLDRHDPLEKASRARKRAEKKAEQQNVPQAVSKDSPVKHVDPHFIPAALHHAMTLRDGDQCTETLKNGLRCPERRWLHGHHIIPAYLGGKTELSNLRTLCSFCHKRLHRLAGTPPWRPALNSETPDEASILPPNFATRTSHGRPEWRPTRRSGKTEAVRSSGDRG